jgi:sec-independent protein translocase protein TatA
LFGIGTQELLILFLVVLLLFGADRIPEVARAVGKSIRDFKRAAGDIESEIQQVTRHKDLLSGAKPDSGARASGDANGGHPVKGAGGAERSEGGAEERAPEVAENSEGVADEDAPEAAEKSEGVADEDAPEAKQQGEDPP